MHKAICFLFCLWLALFTGAQPAKKLARVTSPEQMNSLHQALAGETQDSIRVQLLLDLARSSFQLGYTDSQLVYAQKALVLAQKLNLPSVQAVAYYMIVGNYRFTGRYPEALKAAFANLQVAEKGSDSLVLLEALRQVMFTYAEMEDFNGVLQHARRAQKIVQGLTFPDKKVLLRLSVRSYMNFMGGAFDGLNQSDSALYYRRLAYHASNRAFEDKGPEYHQMMAVATDGFAKFFHKRAMYDSALNYNHLCLFHVSRAGFRDDLAAQSQLRMAKAFDVRNQRDSALFYARLSLHTFQRIQRLSKEMEAASLLHTLYARQQRKDSAYTYLKLTTALKDSLFNQEKIKEVENIRYKEALRRQQGEQEKREALQQYKMRIITYSIGGGILLLSALFFFLYRLRQIKHETRLKTGFTKKIHQIEMRALRAQMNPHFIFNCLNSINRYIVKSDHKTASSYLTKFSRLIRLILDNSASDTITLEKEIQTLQLYIEMEVLRFDNAFQYAIEVDEALCPEIIGIPSMLLQPYVENSIWHGLLHKEDGCGKLWIRFRQTAQRSLVAEIEDNGVGRQKAREMKSKEAVKNKSYGMQISKDRIFLINELYDSKANVEVKDLTDDSGMARGTKVTVEIPVTDL